MINHTDIYYVQIDEAIRQLVLPSDADYFFKRKRFTSIEHMIEYNSKIFDSIYESCITALLSGISENVVNNYIHSQLDSITILLINTEINSYIDNFVNMYRKYLTKHKLHEYVDKTYHWDLNDVRSEELVTIDCDTNCLTIQFKSLLSIIYNKYL